MHTHSSLTTSPLPPFHPFSVKCRHPSSSSIHPSQASIHPSQNHAEAHTSAPTTTPSCVVLLLSPPFFSFFFHQEKEKSTHPPIHPSATTNAPHHHTKHNTHIIPVSLMATKPYSSLANPPQEALFRLL
eukprot:Sspe_Gene.50026::Locus_27485_Transcript_1_1_Confidence_1.000_Length_486::g.50026::m.50026